MPGYEMPKPELQSRDRARHAIIWKLLAVLLPALLLLAFALNPSPVPKDPVKISQPETSK